VAALALCLLCAPVASARPRARTSQADVFASVSNVPTGRPIAPGFVGVSVEYKALHQYTGRDPGAVNPVLIALLRALSPGQSPVLRIGGDSTDATWWPMRGVIPPGGITYGLTPGWIRTTRALAGALGAQLILGINLASGRPALAATEARALLQGIGPQYIRALEIGNEPDLYGAFGWYRAPDGKVLFARSHSYDLAAYGRDFARWRAALPATTLAAPAFAELSWMPGLDQLLSAQPGVGLVTFHRYPLRGCNTPSTSPSFASIPNLLSDRASADLSQAMAPYVQVAHAHGLQFRLDEMNSVACAGTRGVSDTFASALWLLDTLFNMANIGVDGVNVHTLPGAGYELFSFTNSSRGWHAFVHPEYYGMLMFSQAVPPGSQLLPVTVAPGPVKVWATAGSDGPIRVVLINKDSVSHEVNLRVPAASHASLELLQGPTLGATTGIAWGGRGFGFGTTTGTLSGPVQTTSVFPSLGAYTVPLPPDSAVLLTQ
jgi:hypothetical protein